MTTTAVADGNIIQYNKPTKCGGGCKGTHNTPMKCLFQLLFEGRRILGIYTQIEWIMSRVCIWADASLAKCKIRTTSSATTRRRRCRFFQSVSQIASHTHRMCFSYFLGFSLEFSSKKIGNAVVQKYMGGPNEFSEIDLKRTLTWFWVFFSLNDSLFFVDVCLWKFSLLLFVGSRAVRAVSSDGSVWPGRYVSGMPTYLWSRGGLPKLNVPRYGVQVFS